jgi:hypothetical protein
VLAEVRGVAPGNYVTAGPPLWFLARGTRTLYARTDWTPGAFWSVFQSAPHINADHHHEDASDFVFVRGSDSLIVNTQTYGSRSTQPSNALSADSPGVAGTYATSQTPWSAAELVWSRASAPAVYAARADIAKAFNFTDVHLSDIPYAHREWVFLPEGEIVTIDRVRTGAAAQVMYVNFHVNSAGTLALGASGAALGTVGGSQVAITPVFLSGGAPTISQPPVGESCAVGTCTNVRFAVDLYQVKVPGPFATAVHVIDGLAAGEAPATVGSLTSAAYDPGARNAGIIGAGVSRASKQTFVVASSAQDGLAGATMTYGTPGGSAARHIVFDAPENAAGQSVVTTSVVGGQCMVTLAAGAGFAGRPLMFQVSTAASGCIATESTDVAAGTAPLGGGTGGVGGSAAGGAGGGSSAGGAAGQVMDGGVDIGLGGAGGKGPACVVPVTISTNDAGTISVNAGSGCADMSQNFGVSCAIGGSKAPASLLASVVMVAIVLARRRRR